jgi:hypothetical protein
LRSLLTWLAAVVLAAGGSAAQAAVMQGRFEGRITATDASGLGAAPFAALGIAAGDVVKGFVQYETGVVADSHPEPKLGDYDFSPAAPTTYMSITVGSNVWVSGSDLWIRVENDYGSTSITDQLFFDASEGFAQFPGQFGSPLIATMIFRWWEAVYAPPLPTQLNFLPYLGEALPEQSLDFSNTRGEGTISWVATPDGAGDYWALFFSIDPQKSSLTAVPEPPVLPLAALGLLLAAGLRTKAQRRPVA